MITQPASAVVRDDPEQPDEAVVRQVLQGNTALFELLMRRYNERVYRAARAIVRDEHEAEDVMQQAYVNAFSHLHQFNGSARFSTWLVRIAVNEALARVRRLGRYESLDDERETAEPFMSSPPESPERQAFARELGGLLESAIDALPDGDNGIVSALAEVVANRDDVNRFNAERLQIVGELWHRCRLPEGGPENEGVALLGQVGRLATDNLRDLGALSLNHVDDDVARSQRA